MIRHSIYFKIICALFFCPLSLVVIWSRNFWKYFCVLLLAPFLLFICIVLYNVIFCFGFMPFYTYDKEEIRVVEDTNFIFYEKGYIANYVLDSKYYAAHRILLIPGSELVPVGYNFNGEMLVEIYDKDNQLLYSFAVNDFEKLFRDDEQYHFEDYLVYIGSHISRSSSIFAFEVGEIPFDLINLKPQRLKNMKIKITVLKPDEGLLEYCDTATLVIIPDLKLK